jgi:preprotein translocase subunit SecA
MFEVGDRPLKMESNIVQMGPSEDKSVVLAITSTIFSLLGFEVSCASQSEYLAARDYNSFKKMFNYFGVIDMIQYGTLNQICNKNINKDVNIINEA